MSAASQKDVGDENLRAVRAYFASHLCATQKECAEALAISPMAVNRHVKTIRAESELVEQVEVPGDTVPAKHKASHVGAPAVFALELACQELNRAFAGDGAGHCYLVGSALDRADRRDIDIRLMLPDDEFDRLFPNARGERNLHEHDPRWIILTIAVSQWLSQLSGLPVDFQFQRQTQANKMHKGRRDAMGMIFAPVTGPGASDD